MGGRMTLEELRSAEDSAWQLIQEAKARHEVELDPLRKAWNELSSELKEKMKDEIEQMNRAKMRAEILAEIEKGKS